MSDIPQKPTFHVFEGKNEDALSLLQARLTLADPKMILEMVTQSMFNALLEGEIQEQREQEAVDSGEFPQLSSEIIEVLGERVIDQIVVRLSVSTSQGIRDEETLRTHLGLLRDEYIRNHS